MGILGGSIDARTRAASKQRPIFSHPGVMLALHPVELALAAAGKGDGLVAVATRPG
jgi:hypothetical protein